MNSHNTGDDDPRRTSKPPQNVLGRSDRADGIDDRNNDDGVVIPVAFGTRSRRSARYPVEETDSAGPTPDVDDEEWFEGQVIELTPRQRRLVEIAAWTLADDVYDAAEDLHRRPGTASQEISILSDFPPATWTQPAAWWRQQARCFDDLAIDARSGVDPDPVCTGEEMALHIVLARARAMATDDSDMLTELIGNLPAHARDADWEGPLDFLFQDHDVLTLFDDIDDVVPRPGAVNLDPADWFTPFADSEPRTPERGFRR